MSQTQPQTTPFSDAVSVYLLHCRAHRLRPSTIETNRDLLMRFGRWLAAAGVETLEAATPHIIRQYIVEKQERGRAPHYVQSVVRGLGIFFRFCVREELLDETPMRNIPLPRAPRKILPALTATEIRRLLAAAATERDRALLLVMLDTGIRASECANLRVGDVDLNAGSVQIRHGKGDKARTVYVGSKTVRTLLRYMRGMEPEAILFPSAKSGKTLTRSGMRQLIARIAATAGVDCSPHTLRRTFAINSLRNGMNIFVTARLMGHSDISILRPYLEIINDDLRASSQQYGVIDNL